MMSLGRVGSVVILFLYSIITLHNMLKLLLNIHTVRTPRIYQRKLHKTLNPAEEYHYWHMPNPTNTSSLHYTIPNECRMDYTVPVCPVVFWCLHNPADQ
jgi:hypothetical protein